jgi:hypothetical protein
MKISSTIAGGGSRIDAVQTYRQSARSVNRSARLRHQFDKEGPRGLVGLHKKVGEKSQSGYVRGPGPADPIKKGPRLAAQV